MSLSIAVWQDIEMFKFSNILWHAWELIMAHSLEIPGLINFIHSRNSLTMHLKEYKSEILWRNNLFFKYVPEIKYFFKWYNLAIEVHVSYVSINTEIK